MIIEMVKYSHNNMPPHTRLNNINLAVTRAPSNNFCNSFRRSEKLLKNRRFNNNNREGCFRQDPVIYLANKKARFHLQARSLILPQKVIVL